MNYDENTEIIDFMDLIEFTLSNNFLEKWRFKYSEKFIKHFQLKLLEYLTKNKPIKLNTLYIFLTRKCKYSSDQVHNFFNSIEIDLYRPFIAGKITK